MTQFGRRLRELRQAAGLTQSELSRRTGVTLSLICRYEAGSGPKKPHRDTIDRLARGLADVDTNPHSLMMKLREAANPDPLHSPMRLFMQRYAEEQGANAPREAPVPYDELRVLSGAEEIGPVVVRLLDSALSHPPDGADHILITGIGADLFRHLPNGEAAWRAALLDALRKGWTVVHVHGDDDAEGRLRTFTEDLPRYLSTPGRYDPRWFPAEAAGLPACDFVYVPDRGAVVLFATAAPRHLVEGFFCPDQADGQGRKLLDLVGAHARLLTDATSALLTEYAPGSPEFEQALEELERQPGDRFQLMRGLSNVTIPDGVDEARAQLAIANGGEPRRIQAALDLRRVRRRYFQAQIGESRYLDICTRESIVRLATYGHDARGNWLDRITTDRSPRRRLPPEHVVTWLEHVMALLADRRYANYELAVIDEQAMPYINNFAWTVKKGVGVTLGAWPTDDTLALHERDLWTDVPAIVGEYHDSYLDIWSSLSDEAKNKEQLVVWLGSLTADMKRHYGIR